MLGVVFRVYTAVMVWPVGTDGYSIWLRTRSAVTSVRYPPRVTYRIAVSGLDGSAPVLDHYRAIADPSRPDVRVSSISDEQLSRPAPIPRGINVGISLPGAYIPVGRPEPAQFQDLLGIPLLKPTYTFGIGYSAPKGTDAPYSGGLPVIATVFAQKPDYRVTLLGTESLSGGLQTYQLQLDPLRFPDINRLRYLWVDADSYLPRRAIVSGNFTGSPFSNIPWSVDFEVIDGGLYIQAESALATLYLAHRRVVHEARVAFEDIREPPQSIYDAPLLQPEYGYSILAEPVRQ